MVLSTSLRVRHSIAPFSLSVVAIFLAFGSALGEVVLLDFSSPSCGPCHEMRPVVRQLIADGYPIKEVDVSRESRLARDYQVSSVPCFVLLVDGKVVDRVVGRVSRSDIEAMFRRVGFVPQPQTMARGQSPDRPSLRQRLRDRITGVSTTPSSVAPPARPDGTPFAQGAAPTYVPSPAGPTDSQFTSVPSAASPSNIANIQPNTQRLLAATVRIQVVDAVGQSYGTGTIIQVGPGYAIVLTCGHLFRETRGQSPVSVELFQWTPSGLQVAAKAQGEVLRYDLDRDVGLIRIATTAPVSAIDLAPEGSRPQSGDSVVSVGCDHGQAPTVRDSHVTTIDRYSGPSNIEATGAPVEGRSGGGLFNAQNQLIGVCFAADERGNEGLYSGLPSIYEELQRAGIATGRNATLPQRASGSSDQRLAAGPPAPPTPSPLLAPQRPNGVEDRRAPASAVVPATNLVAVTPPAEPPSFRPAENAALQEIARRADGAEVIFIIRSKEPGGSSQVITLDDASPEFIATLLSAAKGIPQTRLTSHAVTNRPPRSTTGGETRFQK